MPFTASAVRDARTNTTVALRRHGVPQHVVDDARLVVTQLLGNALRHAKPNVDGCLVLTVEVQPDAVRLAVSDGGTTSLPTLLRPPEEAGSGRGLGILGTLTREWGVLDDVDGSTVFGVLPIV